MKKHAAVTVGVEGAEEVGRSARIALDPWADSAKRAADAFHSIANAASVAVASAVSDVGRLVISAGHLDFADARRSQVEFADSTARFAVVASQNVEDVRSKFEKLGIEIGRRPKELADFATAVGKTTLDYNFAVESIRGLSNEAVLTNRQLGEMLPLAEAIHQRFGMAASGVDEFTGKLRAMATALGIQGGGEAFQRQLVALGPVPLAGDEDAKKRAKNAAIVGAIGAGRPKDEQQRIQRSVVSYLTSNAQNLEVTWFGHRIRDEEGHLQAEAIPEFQRLLRARRRGRGQARWAAEKMFGPEGGAGFLSADFQGIEAVANLPAEGGAPAVGAALKTPTWQRIVDKAREDAKLRQTLGDDSAIGKAIRAVEGWRAESPITTGIAAGTAGTLLTTGLGALGWTKIIRPVLQNAGIIKHAGLAAAETAATAARTAPGFIANAVPEAPYAMQAADAAAQAIGRGFTQSQVIGHTVEAVAGGRRFIPELAPKIGMGAGALRFLGPAGMLLESVIDMGRVLSETGESSARMMSAARGDKWANTVPSWEAGKLRDKAIEAEAKAPEERSEGMEAALRAEQARLAPAQEAARMDRLIAVLEQLGATPALARETAKNAINTQVEVVLINRTDDPSIRVAESRAASGDGRM